MRFKALSFCLLFLLTPVFTHAQQSETRKDSAEVKSSKALYIGLGTAVTAGILFLDEPLQNLAQRNRVDPLANTFNSFGEKKLQVFSTLGIITAGLISENDSVVQLGVDITKSLLVTGGLTYIGKITLGRHRPYTNAGAHQFEPFNFGHLSLPSGHTSSAFAFATPMVKFLKARMPDILAYTPYVFAGLAGWSRMNDDKHWFSDVVLGASSGVLISKFVTDNINILNLTPTIKATTTGAILNFTVPLQP